MSAAIRAIALFAPIAAVWSAVTLRRASARDVAAMILSTAWALLTLSIANVVAVRAGWWSFQADGAVVEGIPVDLMLGWALLWGALPVHAARGLPLPLVAATLVWLDLALMPLAHPVVQLGPDWLYGEALTVAVCLLPALLLGRWTADDRRLPERAVLQVLLSGGLMLGLPIALTEVWRQPAWLAGLGAQLLVVTSLPGVAAVREFAVAGKGTPLPYDAPARLVTGGPYAYVRNPMQVSMTASYLVLGIADARFLLAAGIAFAYGAGLAAWHENEQLTGRHGHAWQGYRAEVRPWIPRLRPYSGLPPAVVHVAATCAQCAEVGRWIERRRPVALRIVPAEDHPRGIRRMTYERADGTRAAGVAAFAHAAQHLNLGWALVGWLLLLPFIGWFAQLCADALGAGPRSVRWPEGSAGHRCENAPEVSGR
ncbi:methyltransferase family protein [Microtetraspora glauca]|uniref:Methyltransferase n=1 Tax=Microtetraspora glauca TaxID=1996 RepID=A0ABV3GGG1_MICGL